MTSESKWKIASTIFEWNPLTRESFQEQERQRQQHTSKRYQKESHKRFVRDSMQKYNIDFMILTTTTPTLSPEKDIMDNIDLFNIVFSAITDPEFLLPSSYNPIYCGFILTAPPDYKAYCFKLMPEIIERFGKYPGVPTIQKTIQDLESYTWNSFPNKMIQVIGATAPTLPPSPPAQPLPVPAPAPPQQPQQQSWITSIWTTIQSYITYS